MLVRGLAHYNRPSVAFWGTWSCSTSPCERLLPQDLVRLPVPMRLTAVGRNLPIALQQTGTLASTARKVSGPLQNQRKNSPSGLGEPAH